MGRGGNDMAEMESLTKERKALFDEFDLNKGAIADLYYKIEKKN